MAEVWLKSNRRALGWGMVPTFLLMAVGASIMAWPTAAGWQRVIGGALTGVGGALFGGMAIQWQRPRLAYELGEVLFYLNNGPPTRVPVEVVEAFFLGQGPTHLPVSPAREGETVNLVARLSQRATEWARVAVKPALGSWCDGYVTIRGTWCEPLNLQLIRRLNQRLAEVKRIDPHNGKEGAT